MTTARTIRRWLLLAAIATMAILVISVLIKTPRHDRDWRTEYALLPFVEFDGDLATIRNIRNFSYNPDGGVEENDYYDRTYDLSTLTSLWYGISHFYDYGLAHTFLSFEFEGGERFVISIEARQEVGESYHPLSGLLREYELIYVIADERDVIGVRTHIRRERVHLYEILGEPDRLRRFLRRMLNRVNEIYARPEFYNTAIDNCTTGILANAERIPPLKKYTDYRLFLPGYSDEVAWELGVISNDVPLAELRERSRIRPEVTTIDDPDFSRKIRGL